MKQLIIRYKDPMMITLVDDLDYEKYKSYCWFPIRKKKAYYVARKGLKADGLRWGRNIYLHREIMETAPNMEVDHIDGNGLNNQRQNMRNVDRRKNNANRRKNDNYSTKYKGVTYFKRDCNFRAYIKTNGKQIHLGYFDTAREAAHAYDKKAKEIFGEFAQLNFP